MGKIIHDVVGQRRPKCADETAPICPSDCCSSDDETTTKGILGDRRPKKQQQPIAVARGYVRIGMDVDVDANANAKAGNGNAADDENDDDGGGGEIKELVVVGAGPHSLTLVLRLLEPEADLLSDKTRHYRADYDSKMRPIAKVRTHIQKLAKGPSATLRQKRKKKTKFNKRKTSTAAATAFDPDEDPPPIPLETIRGSVLVVDAKSDRWLSQWKQNFEAIGIPKLRSLMNAHADPYDHRALEQYAELQKRDTELVPLPQLQQRDRDFHGPYQVPSTSLFHDYHDLLARGYGIDDIVTQGTVSSIEPYNDGDADEERPLFRITIERGAGSDDDNEEDSTESSSTALAWSRSNKKTIVVRTKRVVCAMGPMFDTGEAFWEAALRKELVSKSVPYPSHRILHPAEIVPFLKKKRLQEEEQEQQRQELQNQQEQEQENAPNEREPLPSPVAGIEPPSPPLSRLLIVGGGITSAQLAIQASKSFSWCSSVKLVQRSRGLPRHFDVENKWMGPRRGQLLESFWELDMQQRAGFLKDARRGGSIPPEILEELYEQAGRKGSNLVVHEEAQISRVLWNDSKELFTVEMDDGSDSGENIYDMIWLVTGSENHLDNYPPLSGLLRTVLPVDTFGGLPVLARDLSWKGPDHEEEERWKGLARKRMWCIGSLAGLELGPDALNLVGARQGAVRVATCLRKDINGSVS